MPEELIEAAPAKVNLALHVTGRRPDGFHDLESLVVFAEVADELRAGPAPSDSLTITGPFATALTPGQTNLVQKAVTAFRTAVPQAAKGGLHIELVKNIPVAAGIGGGSADAAATLRLMQRIYPGAADQDTMNRLAAGLGADVPVCLLSQTALMRGIGEILNPVADFPACHLLLVNPLIPISTASIFRALQHHDNPPLPPLPDASAPLALVGLWLQDTRNDLEPPAVEIAPVIGEIVMRVRASRGCIAARMSGSGATVFGVYGSSADAHQAAHDLRARWPDFWIAAAPVMRAS